MYLARLAVVLLLILLAGCSDDTAKSAERLRVGTNVWPGYEPLYLAREMGYLEGGTVQLVEYTSASDVIRSFRNGVINAAALTLDEALLLQAQNFKSKVVLVLDVSEGADVIVARHGITSMRELQGKKIGVEETALGAFMLSRALDVSGVSHEALKIVPLEVSEHEEALKAGLVDAVVTFEPVRTKLLEWGCGEVFTSKQIPDEIIDVLVVEESYLKANKSAVMALVDGWAKARRFMDTSLDEAAKIMGERQGISAQQFVDSLEGLHIPTLEENRAYFSGKEPKIAQTGAKLLKVLQQKGLIEGRQIDAGGMFVEAWLQE